MDQDYSNQYVRAKNKNKTSFCSKMNFQTNSSDHYEGGTKGKGV